MPEEPQIKSLALQAALQESTYLDDPTRLKEMNKAELFKFLSRPDLQNKLGITIEKIEILPLMDQNGKPVYDEKGQILFQAVVKPKFIHPLTKELKISNLNEQEFLYVNELGDLASHVNDVGAHEMTEHLLLFRELFISTAPSKKGMFLKLSQSEYNIREIEMRQQKRRFFQRKEREE